ncbi:MAG: NlpC/P60 family protein [Sporolactobacillus sp.]
MKTNKRKMTVTLALTVGLTYTVTAVPNVTYAEPSLQDLQSQKSSVASLQAQLSAQQKQLQNDLQSINAKQLDLTGQVTEAQGKINETNSQIEALKSEISTIQSRIDARKTVLNKRLVSIYKNGSESYLDVLFGAKSFSDFINRFTVLHLITSQDQKLLDQQKSDKEAVATKQKTVEASQAANVARLESLKKALADVQTLQAQKQIAVTALSNKQTDAASQLTSLSAAEADMTAAAAKPVANVSLASASSAQSSASAPSNTSAQPAGLSVSLATGGISAILNYGNQFIGRSTYVMGAENPNTRQFDCSGFVNAAFASAGIGVGRTTDALVNEGTPVSINQAQPGDLVFFDTYKTNGHVAIYLGGGRCIGSQDSTGIAVFSLSNSYWSSHFSGVVRRILN